jgi:chemotaxis protein histidine kinase CheA
MNNRWQKCPVCYGEKCLPVYADGAGMTWTIPMGHKVCPVCSGWGILDTNTGLPPQPNSEQKDKRSVASKADSSTSDDQINHEEELHITEESVKVGNKAFDEMYSEMDKEFKQPIPSEVVKMIEQEAQKALQCLYLVVKKDVALDVNNKVWAVMKKKNQKIESLNQQLEQWKDQASKSDACVAVLKGELEQWKALAEAADKLINSMVLTPDNKGHVLFSADAFNNFQQLKSQMIE